MQTGECKQEDETDTSILDGIEKAEPEPETARYECGCDVAASPWEVETEGAGSPEHLCPSWCTETDGEDGQPPWVTLGDECKERETGAPATDEETKGKTEDSAGRDVLRAEEEEPVATVWGGEEVVLKQDSDEEPECDFALDDGAQERGDLVGHLAVVGWQAEEEDDADGPETERNNECHREKHGERGKTEVSPASGGVGADEASPEPERKGVCVLKGLDPACSPNPDRDGRTTLVTEVEGKEEGAAGGGCCV